MEYPLTSPSASPPTGGPKRPRRRLKPRALFNKTPATIELEPDPFMRAIEDPSRENVPWNWHARPRLSDVLNNFQTKQLPKYPNQWRVFMEQHAQLLEKEREEGNDLAPLRLTPAGVMAAKIRADRRRVFQITLCVLLVLSVGLATPLVATALVGSLGGMIYGWCWLAALFVCGGAAIAAGYCFQWVYDTLVLCHQKHREKAEAISVSLQEDPAWRLEREEENKALGIQPKQEASRDRPAAQVVLHNQVLRTQIIKYLLGRLDEEVASDAPVRCYELSCEKLEELYGVWCSDLALDAGSHIVRMNQYADFFCAYLELSDVQMKEQLSMQQASVLIALLVNAVKDDHEYGPIHCPAFVAHLATLKQALLEFHRSLEKEKLLPEKETDICFAYARLLHLPSLIEGFFQHSLNDMVEQIQGDSGVHSDASDASEVSSDTSELSDVDPVPIKIKYNADHYTSFDDGEDLERVESPVISDTQSRKPFRKRFAFLARWFAKKDQPKKNEPLSEHTWRIEQFARYAECFISAMDLANPVIRESNAVQHMHSNEDPQSPVQLSGHQYDNNPYVQKSARMKVYLPDRKDEASVRRVQNFKKALAHLFGSLSYSQAWWLMAKVAAHVSIKSRVGQMDTIDVAKTLMYLVCARIEDHDENFGICCRYAWPRVSLEKSLPLIFPRFRLPGRLFRDWKLWRALHDTWQPGDIVEVALKQPRHVDHANINDVNDYNPPDQLASDAIQDDLIKYLREEEKYQSEKRVSYRQSWLLWCIWMLVLVIGLGVGLSFVSMPAIVGTMGAILSEDMTFLLIGAGVMGTLLLGPIAYTLFVKPWVKSCVKRRHQPDASADPGVSRWWDDRQSCTLDSKYAVMGHLDSGSIGKASQEAQVLEEGAHQIRAAWLAFKQSYSDRKQRLDWRVSTLLVVCGALSIVGVSLLLYYLALPVLAGTLGATMVKQLFALMVGLVVVSHVLLGHFIYLAVLKPTVKRRSRGADRALGRPEGQKWAHYFLNVAHVPHAVFVKHCRSFVPSLSDASVCPTQLTLYMRPSDLLAHMIFYRLMRVLRTDADQEEVLNAFVEQLNRMAGADWQNKEAAKVVIQSLHALCYRVRCLDRAGQERACLLRPDLNAILTHLEQSILHASVMSNAQDSGSEVKIGMAVMQSGPNIISSPCHCEVVKQLPQSTLPSLTSSCL